VSKPQDPARAVAHKLLGEVLRERRALDEARAGAEKLQPRERAFAKRLVTTTLRRLGEIDEILRRLLAKPLAPRAAWVEDALRLGVAQIAFLGIPPHAAVDATVALVGANKPMRGLANAVLRRLAREGAPRDSDPARRNAAQWLWQCWCAAYGEDEARRIALAHLAEPPLDLSVKGDAAAWAERLGGTVVLGSSVRLADPPSIETLPGHAEGAWWVQDAAAALTARLFGPLAGREVLDLCAAPGGKTASFAAAGARVVALDRSGPRLARLKTNLDRLSLSAEIVETDATIWEPGRRFDLIFLDAPCTATGTLRRHPDVQHIKTESDVARMALVQRRLLASALGWLAPGGTLVYAVCSLQPEEGPSQIAWALEETGGIRRKPVSPAEIGGLVDGVTADGDLRTLPSHLADIGGLDGFYAARLVRD
jgi:16S rRNA (cytosine967-C5)-methyltransferase